jgi:hypothetical protein
VLGAAGTMLYRAPRLVTGQPALIPDGHVVASQDDSPQKCSRAGGKKRRARASSGNELAASSCGATLASVVRPRSWVDRKTFMEPVDSSRQMRAPSMNAQGSEVRRRTRRNGDDRRKRPRELVSHGRNRPPCLSSPIEIPTLPKRPPLPRPTPPLSHNAITP